MSHRLEEKAQTNSCSAVSHLNGWPLNGCSDCFAAIFKETGLSCDLKGASVCFAVIFKGTSVVM